MPVKYYVRINRLTVPPSHACITTAEETLGYDKISELIHTLNPSITAAQAKTVLQNFQPGTPSKRGADQGPDRHLPVARAAGNRDRNDHRV